MKNLNEYYQKWSATSEGDQSEWLNNSSTHYSRMICYKNIAINLNLEKKSKVLDVGCGIGNLLKILPESNKYGVDIAKEYIRKAKLNIPEGTFVQASVEKLPFDDEYFDFVFCTEVLEHVNNPEKVVNEISRVCKKNAIVIYSTFNNSNLKNLISLKFIGKHYCSDDHLREYNFYTFKKLLISKFNIYKFYTVESTTGIINRMFGKNNLIMEFLRKAFLLEFLVVITKKKYN